MLSGGVLGIRNEAIGRKEHYKFEYLSEESSLFNFCSTYSLNLGQKMKFKLNGIAVMRLGHWCMCL